VARAAQEGHQVRKSTFALYRSLSLYIYIRADALPLLPNHSFAVAELQDKFNFNAASKVRAGRVIGRCHAALGEHALSVSALDAAIVLARCGRFLLSEALAIRDRALVGQGAGGSGLHWDAAAGTQRLEEVAGRMQGPREPLGQLLGVCLTAQWP
jgi:hypothetical protein